MSVREVDVKARVGDLERFNPGWPELIYDPYPTYERYRKGDPVHWGIAVNPELPGCWYTFRYADCVAALSDKRLKSSPSSVGMAEAVPEEFQPVAHVFLEWLGALDPPKHTRIRSVMAKAFTPRRVNEFLPRIEAIAAELLTAAMADGRPFDLVSDFAFPLPMAVIGDMLGVPPEDRVQFRNLSTQFATAIDRPGDAEAVKAGSAAALQMLEYFEGQMASHRKNPKDDLMYAMMAAANDEGQAMTELEVMATAIELIVAGHETTVSTTSMSTYGMLQSGIYKELASDSSKVTDGVIEELLRWISPVQRQRARWVTEPMELGGRQMQPGESVVVMLGAANRDPEQFSHPDELDFTRPPARHITFGFGIHFCLGAALARLEIGVALRTLFALAPQLALASSDVKWRDNSFLPGLASLEVIANPS
jgi:cytochrome P450